MSRFITKEANPHGLYSVALFDRGMPVEIVVDDKFPCYPDTKSALFTKPKGTEAWVMIMEKAFCKLHGSYTLPESGYSMKALENINGCPAEELDNNDMEPEENWKKIYEFDQKKFIMTCSPRSGQNKSETGLVSGHAYTLISAFEVEGVRLLRIRNPWGGGEWKGDYSDSSDKWTDSLKKAVGYVDENDGSFFMTFDDFRKHYSSFSVGYFHDDYIYKYWKDNFHPRHANYYKFTISETTSVYFRGH
mmetsp:Transcript_12488/g.10739  ORF Transcript_12488/g.10739 Transcript_12488/m.10739 type:complete len:247 (-) Transcript_12488:110-850(-)